jgi:carbonic anhydrase
MSVIQYAIDVLKVKHVIVCGHYGCAGVAAAINGGPDELIDNWLVHIKDLYDRNHPMLADYVDEEQRVDRLCEINVTAQVSNVCHSKIVQAAWQRGQDLKVHGWIYNMTDGLLKDLNITVDTPVGVPEL